MTSSIVPAASSTNSLTVSDDGIRKALKYLQSDVKPTRSTALLPVHVCEAVIASCSMQRAMATPDEAKQATLLLLRGFPNAFTGDPEEKLPYMRGVERIFTAYPTWAVKRVADPLQRKPGLFKYRPTDDELISALEDQLTAMRAYAVRAQWQIDEAKRRESEAALEKQIAAVSAERRATLVEQALRSVKSMAYADAELEPTHKKSQEAA